MSRIPYLIRAETSDGTFFDKTIVAESLPEARDLFETPRAKLGPFDWRGAVVFCQGTKPAEEWRR